MKKAACKVFDPQPFDIVRMRTKEIKPRYQSVAPKRSSIQYQVEGPRVHTRNQSIITNLLSAENQNEESRKNILVINSSLELPTFTNYISPTESNRQLRAKINDIVSYVDLPLGSCSPLPQIYKNEISTQIQRPTPISPHVKSKNLLKRQDVSPFCFQTPK